MGDEKQVDSQGSEVITDTVHVLTTEPTGRVIVALQNTTIIQKPVGKNCTIFMLVGIKQLSSFLAFHLLIIKIELFMKTLNDDIF